MGGVAFRQDEATFDTVTIENDSLENITITAGFANNLNDIENENIEADISILNVKYTLNPEFAASTFYYGIETPDGETLNTMGLRATGDLEGIIYEAKIASQDQSRIDTTALYYTLSAAREMAGVTAKLGYEVFGSDNGDASFTTPLGTNHKFLGWSDTYPQAPDGNGLQDLHMSAVTKVSGVKLEAQLHKFNSVEGSTDLGSEFGLLAAIKFGSYGASVKLAQFNAGDTGVDATKLWLTGTARF